MVYEATRRADDIIYRSDVPCNLLAARTDLHLSVHPYEHVHLAVHSLESHVMWITDTCAPHSPFNFKGKSFVMWKVDFVLFCKLTLVTVSIGT